MKHRMLTALLLAGTLGAQDSELRGVWMTPRTTTGLWTRTEIATAIEAASRARFNVVFFNAWSRGWPLWRSRRFERETGHLTDPAAGNRDLLEEAIVEAHRCGIELHAWMEYGFVGWWTGQELAGMPKGPLLAKHPDWIAKQSSGLDEFPSGHVGTFYWLAHHRPEVQDFLIRLHEEIADLYDADGIELDRIRYPQLDCGYDPYTLAQWKQATGQDRPKSPDEPKWMRWRADALVRFQADAALALRQKNPHLHISNAPSHYSASTESTAYQRLLQDWRAWVEAGSVDSVAVQMYVSSGDLRRYIPAALHGLGPEGRKKVHAGIAARTESFVLEPDELVGLVEQVRKAGLSGLSIWYWNDIQNPKTLEALRTKAFPTPAAVPGRSKGWRPAPILLDERKQKRAAAWREVPSQQAFEGTCLVVGPSTGATIEYHADVKDAGVYDVYAFEPIGVGKPSTRVQWVVPGEGGKRLETFVDQSLARDARWRRLATVRLDKGDHQLIAQFSNQDTTKDRVGAADAVLLLLDRRLSR